jgi:hypothetical protein
VFPAGLVVNVYFVHFDPVGTGGVTNRVASLLFAEPIVGMIAASASLDQSDPILGITSTVTYPNPTTHPDRGLELSATQDEVTFHPGRRRVDLDFRTTTSSDQFRIITLAIPGAPMPMLTNGAMAPIATPADVTLNQLQSSTVAFTFEESSLTLSAPVDIDIVGPGAYTTAGSVTTASIAAGTPVVSQLIHFDPVSGTRTVEASISFTRDILGMIILGPSLDASDAPLGHPNVVYLPVDPNRAVELGNDWIRFSADQRSLRARLAASNGTDQIRVILAD